MLQTMQQWWWWWWWHCMQCLRHCHRLRHRTLTIVSRCCSRVHLTRATALFRAPMCSTWWTTDKTATLVAGVRSKRTKKRGCQKTTWKRVSTGLVCGTFCVMYAITCPVWGRGTPLPPCPFTSSSFPLFTFSFLSLALPIFFFCPPLPVGGDRTWV